MTHSPESMRAAEAFKQWVDDTDDSTDQETLDKLASLIDSEYAPLRARLKEAEGVIAQMLTAMQTSEACGCTDHLDCAPDAGKFWYDARDAARSFLSASPSPAAPTGWRTIDSAPKDRTDVLISCRYKHDGEAKTFVAIYADGQWHEGWGYDEFVEHGWTPTHWLPLPAAPAQENTP